MDCRHIIELYGFWGAFAAIVSAGFLAYPLFFLLGVRDAFESLEAPSPGADAQTIALFLQSARDLRLEYRSKRRRPIRSAVMGVVILVVALALTGVQGYCVLTG